MAQAAVVLRREREKERLRRERDQLVDINSDISISGVGRRGSTPDILHNHSHVTFQNNKQKDDATNLHHLHHKSDKDVWIPGDGKNLQGPTSTKIPRGPRLEQVEENHANFRKKNKARFRPPSGFNGSIKEELDPLEGEDGVYTASGSANVVLYVGLGMICIGLVITFVGLGDKGFKTLELKLIGPSLVGCGVFFALLRILFCTLPSCCKGCMRCCKKKQEDKEQLMKEHPHSAMTGDNVEKVRRKHLSDLPPINNNNLNRGINGGQDDMGVGGGDMPGSNPTNPPLRGRVGPAEDAAPAYSSVVSTATNGPSGNTLKVRSGRKGGKNGKENNDKFDSDIDANDRESEFASEEDGDFRRKPIRTSKNSGSQQGSSNGNVGAKKGANKVAKPLSYDNYSTDTSSQFSVDIVEVAEPRDGNEQYQNRLTTATGIVAQASSTGNNASFEDASNDVQARHYPDYSTIPHFPNLKELAASSDDRNGTEEISLKERNVTTVDSGNAITEEVVLNASRLQVESETA